MTARSAPRVRSPPLPLWMVHCTKRPMALDRLMHDLKVIASQREGDRLYIADGVMHVLHPSAYSTFWRWARGDSRAKSLAAVDSCIKDALTLAEHMLARLPTLQGLALEHARSRVKHLLREIDCAGVGLRQMRSTYIDDSSARASLDVLRESVTNALAALRERMGDKRTAPSGELANLVIYAFDGFPMALEDDPSPPPSASATPPYGSPAS